MKGVRAPEYYLRGNVSSLGESWKQDEVTYALSASTYIHRILDQFRTTLGTEDKPFEFGKFNSPLAEDYHPELDESPLLDVEIIITHRLFYSTTLHTRVEL